jgi:hypothetical protein
MTNQHTQLHPITGIMPVIGRWWVRYIAQGVCCSGRPLAGSWMLLLC